MKISITGGAGFIGASLASFLLARNYEVEMCDSFSDYYSIEYKKLRINDLLAPFNGKVQLVDLAIDSEADKFIKKSKPDLLIHLAAQPGIRLRHDRYQRYVRDNMMAFTNLLNSCVKYDIKNLIYASSSSVYNDSTSGSYVEDSTSLGPRSFYGLTKKWNEEAACHFSQRFGLSTRGLRLFTVYGPWGRPDMAYFRLMSSALKESNFTLFGTGSVQRDFTFINDVVTRIEILAKDLSKQVGGFSDVVNIGGQKPLSMVDLIKAIEDVSEAKITFKTGASDSSDLLRTEADRRYGERIFGPLPYTELSEGISKFYEWASEPQIRSNLNTWIESTI